ncbi:MAG: hypothetical protein ACI4LO_01945 [Anaerovoracaceae bacterium]
MNENREFEVANTDNEKKNFEVSVTFQEDDDMTTEKSYCFKKPTIASYDRYIKNLSKSPTKAGRTFVLDNVEDNMREQLKKDLDDYPAIAITIADKLLGMLGLGDASLKKL